LVVCRRKLLVEPARGFVVQRIDEELLAGKMPVHSTRPDAELSRQSLHAQLSKTAVAAHGPRGIHDQFAVE
jgi:hypothetical protein